MIGDETRIEPRTQAALTELQGILTRHYPAATFSVRDSIDDAGALELWTTVDVDDTDLVLDVVIERLLEMQLDGLRLHVIPVRPPERVRAMRQAEQERRAGHRAII